MAAWRTWRNLSVALIVTAVALAGCNWAADPPARGEQPAPAPQSDHATPADAEPPPPAVPAPAEPGPVPTELVIETVLTGLDVPWGLTFSADGDMWLTERPGRIRVVSAGVMHTLADTAAVGESGLHGVALHPAYPDEPYVFVYQTYAAGGDLRNRVLRFRYDRSAHELSERTVLIDGIPGSAIHDGGQLAFGPDGLLYITTGDAAQPDLAQETGSLAGKILRIAPDGSIPPDNPFGPDSPVWSYGHRNPQGLAFHPETGLLYSSEHGSSGLDELNLITPGDNYGWPVVRGVDHGPFAAPLEVYDPTTPPGAAAFYTGPYEPWHGSLFIGTLGFSPGSGRHLRRVEFAADGRTVVASEPLYVNEFGRIRAVAMGPDGCLYFGTSNRDGRNAEPHPDDDRLLRICAVPAD